MYQKVVIVGSTPESSMTIQQTPDHRVRFWIKVCEQPQVENTAEGTTWFRVIASGSLAEYCQRTIRPDQLFVIEGKLISDPSTGGPRTWTDTDGGFGATFELLATDVQALESDSVSSSAEIHYRRALEPDSVSSPAETHYRRALELLKGNHFKASAREARTARELGFDVPESFWDQLFYEEEMAEGMATFKGLVEEWGYRSVEDFWDCAPD